MPEPGDYVKCDYRDGTYAVAVVERVNEDGSVYVALDRARFATFDAVDVELSATPEPQPRSGRWVS